MLIERILSKNVSAVRFFPFVLFLVLTVIRAFCDNPLGVPQIPSRQTTLRKPLEQGTVSTFIV